MTAEDAVHAPAQAPPAARMRGRPRFVPIVLLLVLGAVGVWVWRTYFSAPPVPPTIVPLSGRIEGDDSAIAPKVAGKIVDIRVNQRSEEHTSELQSRRDLV